MDLEIPHVKVRCKPEYKAAFTYGKDGEDMVSGSTPIFG